MALKAEWKPEKWKRIGTRSMVSQLPGRQGLAQALRSTCQLLNPSLVAKPLDFISAADDPMDVDLGSCRRSTCFTTVLKVWADFLAEVVAGSLTRALAWLIFCCNTTTRVLLSADHAFLSTALSPAGEAGSRRNSGSFQRTASFGSLHLKDLLALFSTKRLLRIFLLLKLFLSTNYFLKGMTNVHYINNIKHVLFSITECCKK